MLEEKDGVDTELLVYTMTLLNKVRPPARTLDSLPSSRLPCLFLHLTSTFRETLTQNPDSLL